MRIISIILSLESYFYFYRINMELQQMGYIDPLMAKESSKSSKLK
jgi:hypothetical protein